MNESLELKMSNGVTMPDSSVFGALMRGHPRVAQDLAQLIAKGETIVVPSSTYAEIKKTPNVVTRNVQLTLIDALGMKVQATSLAQRADMYERVWSHLDERRSGVQKKDLPILADVSHYQQSIDGKTKSVKLWTVERMANNQVAIARDFKITFSPLSGARPVGPFVKPDQVISLFPSLKGRYRVTADGRIVQTAKERLRQAFGKLGNVRIRLANIKWGGRGGLGLKLVRGLGLAIIVSLIGGWLQSREDEKQIKEYLEKVEGVLKAKLEAAAVDIAKAQLRSDPGEKVYVVYIVEIHFGHPYGPLGREGNYYKYPYNESPTAWLAMKDGFLIRSSKTAPREAHETEKMFMSRIERYTRSAEVEVLSHEELEAFREIQNHYRSVKLKLGMEPANPALNDEKDELLAEMVGTFGEDLLADFLAAEKTSGFQYH